MFCLKSFIQNCIYSNKKLIYQYFRAEVLMTKSLTKYKEGLYLATNELTEVSEFVCHEGL